VSKEKRLGRGLEALLGKVAAAQPVTEGAEGTSYALEGTSFGVVSDYDEETPTDQAITEMMRGKPILDIPVSQIDRNPYQPRLDFDLAELNDLAASIQRFGMLQPIVLRRQQDRYELIAGERRLRAAVLAGWKEVPAYLLVVQDREMAELALTENMQRQDLNAIEKAIAFRNYLDTYGGTQEELAKRLELDRSTVSNMMRLLDLPEELQLAVRKGDISQGHARALLPLEEHEQLEVAARIMEEGWSVRQTEAFVQEVLSYSGSDGGGTGNMPAPPSNKRRTSQDNPQIRELEQQFHHWLGTKVKLTANDKGRGKLVIQFNSNDEFERIYQLLCPSRTNIRPE